MNTSTNVHNVDNIKVAQDSSENIKWLNISFDGKMGTHKVTVFHKDLLDLFNACEKALHEEGVIVNADVVGYTL